MTNEETYIGLWNDYECTDIITYGQLKRRTPTFAYELSDYLDWRKTTNLQRFVYDPFTGEKIDWEKLRKEVNSIKYKHENI